MVTSQIFTATTDGNLSFLLGLKPEQLTDKVVDEKGANCCHYASRAGRVDVIEYLVQSRQFSPHKRSEVGSTPAHDAAASGKLSTLQWLLKQAKPPLSEDDQDGTGATILHLAARYGHASVVEWILDNTQTDLTVIKAASGALPLHFAASGGSVDTVQILLKESPRSVNMQMMNGATPIYIAAQSGQLEVLKLLVQKGGTVKINSYDGMSCLHAAAQSGHLECVKFLVLDQKCNVNERDFDGASPLHYAASLGHIEVVRWLLTQGGAKVTLDNLGGSPLHNAAEVGHLKVVRVLLENHCSPDITDNQGLTAAELAEKCSHDQCAKEIKAKQAGNDVEEDDTQQTWTRHLQTSTYDDRSFVTPDCEDSRTCTLSQETGECEKSDQRQTKAFDWTDNSTIRTEQIVNTSPQRTKPSQSGGISSQNQPVNNSTNFAVEEEIPVRSVVKTRTEVTRNKSFGTSDFLQRYSGVRELPPLTKRPVAPVNPVFPYDNRTRMSEAEKEEVQQLSPHTYRTRKTLLLTELNDKVRNSQVNGGGPQSDGHVHEAVSSRRPESRDVSPMSRSSPSSSVYSDSARSSPTPPSTDLIAELKKAAVAPTLKKTKKPSEEGKMNFIYSFGGPVKTGAVSNGATNHNSNGTADKLKKEKLLLEGDFDPKNFMDQIDGVDKSGNPIPDWKKQMLARNLAEKAFKEYEEKRKLEEIEARFKNMPLWKRQLIERKEAEARAVQEQEQKRSGH